MGQFIQIVDEAEQFTYRLPDFDSVITCRPLHPEKIGEINSRYEKVDYRRGRQKYVPTDRERDVQKDIWDSIVVSWEHVTGKDGQPVPCTRDTKWLLPGSVKLDILELADRAGRREEPGSPNSDGSSSAR